MWQGHRFFEVGSSRVGQESRAESLEPDSMPEIAFFSGSGLSSLDFRVFQRHTQFETGDGPAHVVEGLVRPFPERHA